MTRAVYVVILLLHPPAFRRRFGEEMLSIFDEGETLNARLGLLIDGCASIVQQWLWRTDLWKLLLAMGVAYIEIWGFALPARGHQSWTENREAITPYTQEVILLTLALVASIFLMTMSLTVWIVRFQGRRSRRCRLNSAEPRASRRAARLLAHE